MDENNKLIPVAMKIILNAGNARNKANGALDYIKQGNYAKARELIKAAQSDISKAHQAQTDIIQKEAAGEEFDSCMLFTHAQDTLMTIMTEVNLTDKLIELFEFFDNKMLAQISTLTKNSR